MSDDRVAALAAVLNSEFSPDDMTAAGLPKVEAINARMPEGAAPVTAAERDAAWANWQATEPELEPVPDEPGTLIRLDAAAADPLPVYVHGVGLARLRVGETATVSGDVLAALRASDAQFTILE